MDFLNVESGVKQGGPLSPMLFNLFINHLVSNINNEQCGVKADIDNVSILFYANDIYCSQSHLIRSNNF